MGFEKTKRPVLVPFLRFEAGAEIRAGAGAPTDGTTGAGSAAPGSIYLDVTNNTMYHNTGSAATPAWEPSSVSDAIEVYNESGGTIEDGDLVYLSGYDETNAKPTIDLADADAQGTRAEFVIRTDIANLAVGLAHKTYRETGGIDLAAAAEGDPLFLSTTPGDATLTDPTDLDPNGISQVVGFAAIIATDVTEYNLRGNQRQVGTNEIQDSANTAAKLATDSVTTVKILAANVTQAKMEEGSMVFIKAELTDANALALATGAGIEVIPTPGADKAIIVHRFTIIGDAGAGAWVEPSAPDDLVLQYAGGADISGTIESGVLVAADVAARTYGVLETEVIPEANVGVNLFNTGANWTGGNVANSLDLHIFYSIVDTVAFT